jgi:hypothetical protein
MLVYWQDADRIYRIRRDKHLIETMAKGISLMLAMPPWDVQDAASKAMAERIVMEAISEVRRAQRAYPDAFADF